MHHLDRDIVEHAAIDQDIAIAVDERRQYGRQRTRRPDAFPQRPSPVDMQAVGRQVGRDAEEIDRLVGDIPGTVAGPEFAIENRRVQQRVERQGETPHRLGVNEHRLHLVEHLLDRQTACNRAAHRRAGAGTADKIDRNVRLPQRLDHAEMGAAEGPASGQHHADRPAGQEAGDLGKVGLVVERDMMVQLRRARIDPFTAAADRLAGIGAEQQQGPLRLGNPTHCGLFHGIGRCFHLAGPGHHDQRVCVAADHLTPVL